VNTGHRVLQLIMPALVDIMLRQPEEDWGEIHVPVVK